APGAARGPRLGARRAAPTDRRSAMRAPSAQTSEADVVAGLRAVFDDGHTLPLEWRRRQLNGLQRLVTQRERDLAAAVKADLGRDAMTTFLADIGPVRAEIGHSLRSLSRWASPRRVRVPVALRPGRAAVEPRPKGIVLVIGAWNFPILLTLQPLVSALAAGNVVALKPSELAPETAAVLERLLPAYVDAEAVRVVTGGAEVSTTLLAERFDHIFFTGSTRVGRIVAEAAALHLTPTTLELGGKSPVIVAADADLDVAARRIAWAKCFNTGQACLAPDYLLVEATVRDAFRTRLVEALRGAAAAQPGRIVDRRQFDRLAGLLRDSGGDVVGGAVDEAALRMGPAVVVDPAPNSRLMQDEIFGPILPVVTVPSVDEAVRFVRQRPDPLALYVFTEFSATADAVLAATTSGTAAVNHLLQQLLVPDLPFGGVGPSGMGAYHGRVGFDTFSHLRGVLRRPTTPDPSIAYPPYGPATRRLLRRFLG
ncbi:MAG TPA: aldehyde dehydrogenase family protein, partial [Kineosporiaceae bacterium]|nr:aldehyde dehydrogenase family protein [Kineosporiaceae bacterium]